MKVIVISDDLEYVIQAKGKTKLMLNGPEKRRSNLEMSHSYELDISNVIAMFILVWQLLVSTSIFQAGITQKHIKSQVDRLYINILFTRN